MEPSSEDLNTIAKTFFYNGFVSLNGESGKQDTFRVGTSGVAFQEYISDPLHLIAGYPGSLRNKGTYSTPVRHLLKLIKIGQIRNGVGVGSYLASWKVGQGLIAMSLQTSTIIIQHLSCETPDVKVTMGREVLSAITLGRGTATLTNFQISLNNCLDGINDVTEITDGSGVLVVVNKIYQLK